MQRNGLENSLPSPLQGPHLWRPHSERERVEKGGIMSRYTKGMTLEQMIGQTLCVGFDGLTPTPEIIDLIQRHHVGNIIFFSRNVRDTEQLRTLTESLQKIAREAGQPFPLIITIDQEN